MAYWPIAVGIGLLLTIAAAVPVWRRRQRRMLRCVLERFAWQREQLEAKFADLASRESRPDGWRWERVEFSSVANFVRDRDTGRTSALVEVTIGLSPIDSEPLASGEEPQQHRHATAVFHVFRQRWTTQGRVFFNLSPRETLTRYQDRYEALRQR